MDKRSRAYKIYEAGLLTITKEQVPSEAQFIMLEAIASMIDYATAKQKKKNKEPMLYDEKAVIECFETALDITLEVTRYGSINRALRTMILKESDLAYVASWLTEVMLPWANSKDDFTFTHSMIARKYAEWLEKARQHVPTVGSTTAGWR